MVAVHDEVRLLHGVARKEVGANALLGRELLQVVQVVNSGRESDLRGKIQRCLIYSDIKFDEYSRARLNGQFGLVPNQYFVTEKAY